VARHDIALAPYIIIKLNRLTLSNNRLGFSGIVVSCYLMQDEPTGRAEQTDASDYEGSRRAFGEFVSCVYVKYTC